MSKTNESYALKDFESSKSIASVSIGSIHGKKASFCAGGDILGWFSKSFKILNLVGSHVRPIRKQVWAYHLKILLSNNKSHQIKQRLFRRRKIFQR